MEESLKETSGKRIHAPISQDDMNVVVDIDIDVETPERYSDSDSDSDSESRSIGGKDGIQIRTVEGISRSSLKEEEKEEEEVRIHDTLSDPITVESHHQENDDHYYHQNHQNHQYHDPNTQNSAIIHPQRFQMALEGFTVDHTNANDDGQEESIIEANVIGIIRDDENDIGNNGDESRENEPISVPGDNNENVNDNSKHINLKNRPMVFIGSIIILLVVIVASIVSISMLKPNNNNNNDSLGDSEVDSSTPILINNTTNTNTNTNDTNDTNNTFDDTFWDWFPENNATFEMISKRGYVKCGVSDDLPGFSFRNDIGKDSTISGFNVDLCRAIAAAMFDGDDTAYRLIVVDVSNREDSLDALGNGTIDVLSLPTTLTSAQSMELDLYHQSSTNPSLSGGFSFSYPYFINGMRFMVIGDDVDIECVDQLELWGSGQTLDCNRVIIICVQRDDATPLQEMIGGSTIQYDTEEDAIQLLQQGTCEGIVSKPSIWNPIRYQHLNQKSTIMSGQAQTQPQPATIGHYIFSLDPLSLVTRDGCPQWSSLVNSVIQLLYTAESLNITADTVHEKVQVQLNNGSNITTPSISPRLVERMKHVVESVGNYGDLYDKHLKDILPRSTQRYDDPNDIDSNVAGLMVSLPFRRGGGGGGQISQPNNHEGEDDVNDTLVGKSKCRQCEQIQQQKIMRCGIMEQNIALGFLNVDSNGDFTGLDYHICQAIASAMSSSNVKVNVEIVVLPSNNTETFNQKEAYEALVEGDIDVILGESITVANQFDVTLPSFDDNLSFNFAFSTPYYYDNESPLDRLNTRAVVTSYQTQDDQVWSSLVGWIILALIHAEEYELTGKEMPLLNFVGPNKNYNYFHNYQRMLQRSIETSGGNFGQMYATSLQNIIPRSGRNMLNRHIHEPSSQSYRYGYRYGPQQVSFPLFTIR